MLIPDDVAVGGLPVRHETQYFRSEAVVAVCRNRGRLQPHQSRFFLLYRDPTRQFGCGRMPLDVQTFRQAVKAAEALGVSLLKREFTGSQSGSRAYLSELHIGGIERYAEASIGFVVEVPGIQYGERFYSIGQVDEFLSELSDARRFVELVEPPNVPDHPQCDVRYWYDATAIQKVKLANREYGDRLPCVHVYVDGRWQPLKTDDLSGVIAKIESAGAPTTCLRMPKE